MMLVTRQILGNQDFPKNPQKTLFANFANAARKPSKNPPAPTQNVEKPSKNLPRRVFLRVFEGFCHPERDQRGARASLRWQTLREPSKTPLGDCLIVFLAAGP